VNNAYQLTARLNAQADHSLLFLTKMDAQIVSALLNAHHAIKVNAKKHVTVTLR